MRLKIRCGRKSKIFCKIRPKFVTTLRGSSATPGSGASGTGTARWMLWVTWVDSPSSREDCKSHLHYQIEPNIIYEA
jgi:hypothetical protein